MGLYDKTTIKKYGIAISCTPSDRLIIDENGEEFFECANEEEMTIIQKGNGYDSLKTHLFNMLSMMDSTISAIATKTSPAHIKIIFVIKDGIKGSVLNISNENLSATEIIVLGGITIAIGITTALASSSVATFIAGIIISYVLTWLLNNTYIYLRDNAPQIWQNAKNKANDAWQYIMSLIESDSRSLNEKKQSLTQKATDEILSIAKQRQAVSKDYEKCVTLLCEYNKNNGLNSIPNIIQTDSNAYNSTNTKNNQPNFHKNSIVFIILALDKDAKTPIPNADIELQNANVGQKATTNNKGLAYFNIIDIIETQKLKCPFNITLKHKDYQESPISNRNIVLNSIKRREGKPFILRFNKKLDNFAVQNLEIKSPYTILNNEIIVKNFYKANDIITLKANYDNSKTKSDEIKWAYKIMDKYEIAMLLKKESKDKNPQSIQKYDDNLSKTPNGTCQILLDKNANTYFSHESIYTIKNAKEHNAKSNNIYKGANLEIKLPEYFKDKQIAIFAYKNEPNWNVCQLLRLNDYPQITIDCTLAETLRANAKNDKISTLGWGVSYICQRLWHDNPANAKELGELIYTHSRRDEFLDSIPNETMRWLVAETLPQIELKEFALNSNTNQRIKSHIQDDKNKNLRFYVELDWEEFYMQFPLMKNLKREFLNVDSLFNRNNNFQREFIDFYKQKMKTEQINYESHPLKEYKISLNTKEMQKGETSNIKVFDICDDKDSIPQGNIAIGKLDKPSQIISNKIYFQRFSIDIDIFLPHFGLSKIDAFPLSKNPIQHKNTILNKFNRDDKHRQNFALYSIAGSFNIIYIFDSIAKNKKKSHDSTDSIIYFSPNNIKTFIIDSVDFNNDKDENGRDKRDQPIGVWDYENICFDLYYSVLQYRQNRMFNNGPKLPMSSIFFLYNSDFIQTKYHFALGLDFFIYTKSFYYIKQWDK